jgi:predicted nucleotidyltransferase
MGTERLDSYCPGDGHALRRGIANRQDFERAAALAAIVVAAKRHQMGALLVDATAHDMIAQPLRKAIAGRPPPDIDFAITANSRK